MSDEAGERLGQLRKELVDFTIALFTYSGLAIVPIFFWRSIQEREDAFVLAQLLPFAISTALIVLHLCRDYLDTVLRAILLSGLLVVCSVAGLISRGILGPAFCFMLLAIICLSLILPLRRMLVAATIIILVNIAVVALHLFGFVSISIDPVQAFNAPATWISYIMVPVYASALIIFSFSRFNMALETILKDLQREKANVEHLAHHDPLTGLPNMRVMNIRADQAFAMAKRNQATPALMFVDLDHFKFVNDHFGHEIGDRLLQQVSERISRVLRSGDTVVRNGGDEFLILLTHYTTRESLLFVAHRICAALDETFNIDEVQCEISCSIGIARYPEHGEDLATLIHNADVAMYEIKRSGKNGANIYDFQDQELFPAVVVRV